MAELSNAVENVVSIVEAFGSVMQLLVLRCRLLTQFSLVKK